MELERCDVRHALKDGQFFPLFQPIVVLRTGKLAGFEVLARWKHPVLGMISPETFIPMAERDGWIGALAEEILRNAFTSASAMPHSLTLSVNVSPMQLKELSLPEQIRTLAKETGFSLDRVIVEITETALADNFEQARAITLNLKALGCRIALDDFGTGYSSLRHFQKLPFDELKVDRSFVASMTEARESRKIVAAVVGLGQSLGLTTVAEGVASQDQADMLLWLGCDLGQGWLYGRPIPAEELPTAISTPRPGAASNPHFAWKNLSPGNLEGLPSQRLAQLQAVYDGAPVGLGFLDRNLRYVNLNQRLADAHGASVEEHIGRHAAEMIPDLIPQIEPFLQRALRGESVANVEVKEPGGGRTFLGSYQPARDEAGEVVGVSCAVLDFTARKRAEEKLRQFERVVECLDEMIVVVDRDYRFVLANRAFLNSLGLEADQLVGRIVPDVIDHNIFETVVKWRLEECFQGNSIQFESRYRFPILGERDLLVSYAPIEIAGGITGAACVLQDVTELKRMERAETDWRKRIE